LVRIRAAVLINARFFSSIFCYSSRQDAGETDPGATWANQCTQSQKQKRNLFPPSNIVGLCSLQAHSAVGYGYSPKRTDGILRHACARHFAIFMPHLPRHLCLVSKAARQGGMTNGYRRRGCLGRGLSWGLLRDTSKNEDKPAQQQGWRNGSLWGRQCPSPIERTDQPDGAVSASGLNKFQRRSVGVQEYLL
jgi:hypothetical protein